MYISCFQVYGIYMHVKTPDYEYGEPVVMPADGRRDLTLRLKGYCKYNFFPDKLPGFHTLLLYTSLQC